jgi:hypothetical protein
MSSTLGALALLHVCASAVQPLPPDALQLLVDLKLHITTDEHGWTALHYACASHRVGECR